MSGSRDDSVVRVGRFCSACLGSAEAGQQALRETFLVDGNPERVPLPSRDGTQPARPAGSPRDLASLIGLARGICARRLEAEPRVSQPAGTPDLRQAVAALKPTQREALLARAVAGLSFADVARAFATDQAVIVERANRALEQLRLTMQLGEPVACRELAHDLATVVDGEPDAVAKHASHLATCDACRDLRHDARQILAQVSTLSSDFQPAADLAAQPAAKPAAPAPAPKPAEPAPADPAPPATWTFGKKLGLFLGLSTLGVLAVLGLADVLGPRRPALGTAPPLTASSLRVARIVRAAADAQPGLFERVGQGKDERALAAGAAASSGATLRTDNRTRAWLQSSAGVEVVMDHGTLLRVGPASELALDEGEIALASTQAPQRLQVPGGWVELEQGRGLVTAATDNVSVRLMSGRATVHGRSDTPIAAGQEALLSRDGQVRTATALGLAAQSAWSEANPEPETDAAGLGELRARRPGEASNRDKPLHLASHKATVRILGPVARTEIDESFQNDGNDTLEGIYRFPLPADAQLERLALEVDGQMQEGAFVERDRAAAIWRGVMHHAAPQAPRPMEEMVWVPGPWRDPALLEWQRGGRFELRIFPIPPHGARRVIVAYSQTIAPQGDQRRYVYPLPHAANRASEVGAFQLDVRVSGTLPSAPVSVRGYEMQSRRDDTGVALTFERSPFLPTGDLVIDYQLPNPEAQMRSFTFQRKPDEPAYVMFAIRPKLPAWNESKPRDHLLLVDSSQSMTGERWARAARLATSLLGEMDRRDRVWLAACDLDCRLLDTQARTPSQETAQVAKDFLATIRPAGSSDLFTSIRSSIAMVRGQRQAGRELRVLYLGDGMSSVGFRTPGALSAQVRKLRADTPELAISAVGIGSDADSAALDAVVRAGGGQLVAYRPGERLPAVAMKVLESSYGVSLQDISLQWPAGLREISPSNAGTLREGEELLAFGRFTGEINGTVELHGTVGGKPYVDRYPVSLQASTAPANAFVPRMWAAATIARLELESADAAKPQIINLSRSFAVLSRYTSLLVLESPAMMHAFGVEQNRVASDWTGEGELDSDEASGTVKQEGPTVSEAKVTDAMASTGGMGMGGKGEASGMGMARAAAKASALPAPASAPAMAAEAVDMAAKKKDVAADKEIAAQPSASIARPILPEDRFIPRQRTMILMRKVWTKEARLAAWQPRPWSQAVAGAEQALAASPDSRDRHRRLVQLLSRNGELERAQQVAERWLERDRMDAEALTALADLFARQGERHESLRTLSGIVDLEPDNKALHDRLARAFERLGTMDYACSHRIVLAELSPNDPPSVAAALRCDRITDWHGAAEAFLPRLANEPARRRAQTLSLAAPPRTPTRGDVTLDATWNTADDLDLALISPTGTRISWMGGRKSVFADRVSTPGQERLGLVTVTPGTYLVEVSRTTATNPQPIRGRIRLKALNMHQDVPFYLLGRQVVTTTLVVERKMHLEQVRGPVVPRR